MTKSEIHRHCVQQVEERIDRLNGIVKSVQSAANEDTKSSAGDKYETNREMMQAEKDKALQQLSEALKLRKVLDAINTNLHCDHIELGALASTSIGDFYFSAALGEIHLEDKVIYAISVVSPLGKELIGQKTGDKILFNGREVEVKYVN